MSAFIRPQILASMKLLLAHVANVDIYCTRKCPRITHERQVCHAA